MIHTNLVYTTKDYSIFNPIKGNRIKNQPSALTDCGNTKQYLTLIEEIYNYRRREKINLRY